MQVVIVVCDMITSIVMLMIMTSTMIKMIEINDDENLAANDVIASTVKEIGKQFRQVGSQHNCLQLFTLQSWSDIFQAFMVEETKRDIYNKVSSIENRVESTITSSSSSSSSSLP